MADHGPAVPPGDPQNASQAPRSLQGGDPSSPLPLAPEPLMDDESHDIDISDIWTGDDGYDIWGEENDDESSDVDSIVSVINIPESPKIIEISSEEEDSWISGSDTSNSSDPDYQPRGWNRRRKYGG